MNERNGYFMNELELINKISIERENKKENNHLFKYFVLFTKNKKTGEGLSRFIRIKKKKKKILDNK